ncbi:neutral/alkaline ceramidase [Sansalvadorimonas sp. 2012CJ34-2]|uniref:Neutral ceramidase n=1 Tax=Parendozoicomonas callyspongiae TaxID=2942213 RepID=A0ABT0PI43_9GAMM|nr:neutral/alkaline non-lysosomal ceramidase N-terminal domain-containing protein [Sansalvadorimonas sp. 2012CJ34-2]MCL6270916.1 neutral/alkaline ceramidase [Sansalvadorimonas sp. 2012CJ34-2]
MRSPLVILLIFFCPQTLAVWLVGVGKSDITGPAADVGMIGYADSNQISAGIHDRLWARAFIVADQGEGKKVIIVSISAGMTFGNVKREVLARLQEKYGESFEAGNLLIVADHTHSSPGGQSFHFLFVMGSHGFERDAWEAQVEGIVEAISIAYDSLKPGRVLINRGELFNANANRSIKAWLRNPEAAHMPSIDPEMVVMRFEQGDKPVGMLGWFATHGVSFPMTNRLVSGDNKSYAAWLMEGEQGEGFVAAFPQTNSGDMTPNLYADGTGPGKNPEENARIIGGRQYRKGSQLFHSATEELSGSLDWQHEYVDFGQISISRQWTGLAESISTCPPATGYAFAAGCPDGRPRPYNWFFKEGQKSTYWPISSVSRYLTGVTPEVEYCHAPKPLVMLLEGRQKFDYINHMLSGLLGGSIPSQVMNHEWIPQILPVAIVKIGSLGLLGVPAEFTYIAGHRLKSAVKEVEGTGLEKLVVAGYANDYSLYVTTPDEYLEQLYEGGATLFGRWTLGAYQQTFEKMALNLAYPGTTPPSEFEPEDLSMYYRDIQAPDIQCRGEQRNHGKLLSYIPDMLWNGQVVKACFTASNPRLAVRKLDTFLTVERYDHERKHWYVVANDDSWDTRFFWHPQWYGKTQGYVCVEWTPPARLEAGTYRLGHHGLWRENSQSDLVPYHGYTRRFAVVREAKVSVMLMKAKQSLAHMNAHVGAHMERQAEAAQEFVEQRASP